MFGVAPALNVGSFRLALGLDLRDNLLDHLGLLLRLDLLQNLKMGRADSAGLSDSRRRRRRTTQQ